MPFVRLAVDYEFPSRTWWETGGQELWEAVADGSDVSAVVLDGDLAASWLARASRLPGWEDGPEYAPHPISMSPIGDDDADIG